MSGVPKATRGVIFNNPRIADEFIKYGTITPKKGAPVFRRKPKSDATKAREASERRYTRRSNICGSCHMAKPVGSGVCDNCS